MTKEEFKDFFSKLRELFPYAYKSDEDIKRWYEAMRDVPYGSAVKEIKRRKKEEDAMPSSMRRNPEPHETAHNAKEYHGAGSLLWKAIRGMK